MDDEEKEKKTMIIMIDPEDLERSKKFTEKLEEMMGVKFAVLEGLVCDVDPFEVLKERLITKSSKGESLLDVALGTSNVDHSCAIIDEERAFQERRERRQRDREQLDACKKFVETGAFKDTKVIDESYVRSLQSVMSLMNPQALDTLPKSIRFAIPQREKLEKERSDDVPHDLVHYVRMEALPTEVRRVVYACLADFSFDKSLSVERTQEEVESIVAAADALTKAAHAILGENVSVVKMTKSTRPEVMFPEDDE